MTNIAIITGGDSSEAVISLKSAEQVQGVLPPERYRTRIVRIRGTDWQAVPEGNVSVAVDRNDFSFVYRGRKERFDFAFLAMHGPPGEDGTLQAYLDLLGIPYSTSGVLSLALSFNKFACKSFLSHFGIPTARTLLLGEGQPADAEAIIRETGLPCFIKPNRGGSSFGVSKITGKSQLNDALEKAREEDEQVIIEEFLDGPEYTCGLVKFPDREMIFPLTQIVSRKEFFDYEAKYTAGMADEITPAKIPAERARRCRQLASRIYDLMDCRGIVRIDFIYSGGKFRFLELNGVPGMTGESIVPKQIRAYGMTEAEVYGMIIDRALGMKT